MSTNTMAVVLLFAIVVIAAVMIYLDNLADKEKDDD